MRSDPSREVVLYVEDHAPDAAFMRDFLSASENVALVVASSGELAVDVAADCAPRVVLLDVDLGDGIDGFEVYHRLRALPGTADVPVIALTANDNARDRVRALHLGFLRYLVKPVKLQDLADALSLVVPIAPT